MKIVEYIIRLKDEASAAITKVRGELSALSNQAKSGPTKEAADDLKKTGEAAKEAHGAFYQLGQMLGGGVLGSFTKLIALGGAILGTFKAISAAVDEFARKEVAIIKLGRAFGSLSEGRATMNALQESSVRAAFGIDALVAGSIKLRNMTDGGLGDPASIELIGQAAKGANVDFMELADGAGMLWGRIAAGETQLSLATRSLVHMGVMTRAQANELDAMAQSGRSAGDQWAAFEAILAKAADRANIGTESLIGMRKANEALKEEAMATWGELFAPVLKFFEKVKEAALNVFGAIGEGLGNLAKLIGGFFGSLSTGASVSESWGTALDLISEEQRKKQAEKDRRAAIDAQRSGVAPGATKPDKDAQDKADEAAKALQTRRDAAAKAVAEAEQRARIAAMTDPQKAAYYQGEVNRNAREGERLRLLGLAAGNTSSGSEQLAASDEAFARSFKASEDLAAVRKKMEDEVAATRKRHDDEAKARQKAIDEARTDYLRQQRDATFKGLSRPEQEIMLKTEIVDLTKKATAQWKAGDALAYYETAGSIVEKRDQLRALRDQDAKDAEAARKKADKDKPLSGIEAYAGAIGSGDGMAHSTRADAFRARLTGSSGRTMAEDFAARLMPSSFAGAPKHGVPQVSASFDALKKGDKSEAFLESIDRTLRDRLGMKF